MLQGTRIARPFNGVNDADEAWMVNQYEMLLRLVLAVLLGGVIGLERERLQWAAGLRTHILVCVGATLFMIVSSFGFAEPLLRQNVMLDPSRVAAQVVSGIGFLGAGTILFRRDKIRGLTTAASLWTVAAIGLAVGGGLYTTAIGGTLIIFGVLAGLKPLERRFFGAANEARLVITVEQNIASLASIEAELTTAGYAIRSLSISSSPKRNEDEITVLIRPGNSGTLSGMLERLKQMPGVLSAALSR